MGRVRRALPSPIIENVKSKVWSVFSPDKELGSHWDLSSTCPGPDVMNRQMDTRISEKEGTSVHDEERDGRPGLWWLKISSKESNDSFVMIVVRLLTNFSKSVQALHDRIVINTECTYSTDEIRVDDGFQ